MRRLNLGVASYGNPEGLQRLINSVVKCSRTDWQLHIIVNPHPDEAQRERVATVIDGALTVDPRIKAHEAPFNLGYVGAVNRLLKDFAVTEYFAYLDHDVEIVTSGWDEKLALMLDRFHELGMVFPAGGAAPIDRGAYNEILWGVGCCWMLPVRVAAKVGYFDDKLGHQEEVDYQTRVRLAGLKIAAAKDVLVRHEGKASNDPASTARISAGVINWVNKWCRYFCGEAVNYYSPNVMRHEDWPTSALHMEQYFKAKFQGTRLENLNENPDSVIVDGTEYDLIRVPRLKGFYRHRII